MTVKQRALDAYQARFGAPATAAAFAPGRVEIMGNHTDYNGGFVLPAAIDKGTVVAGTAVAGDEATVHAVDLDRTVVFSVSRPLADPENPWASYVMGVVEKLRDDGVSLGGFHAVVHSDVPAGAGLSSSAALEVATAYFLRELYPHEREPMRIARLCQMAENEFVGVSCGIMDQFASVFGQSGSLLFLDCLSLEHRAVRMARPDVALLICNSQVRHTLAGGDYNTRRAECMAAARHFGKELLRDVAWDEFLARAGELPENQRKRAHHVLRENARVLEMLAAVQGTDTASIGAVVKDGHASCRDLFEDSAPEIDFLVDVADGLPGCIGAKMFGGGWGGCTLNLVLEDAVPEFSAALKASNLATYGIDPPIYPCHAGGGAHAFDPAIGDAS